MIKSKIRLYVIVQSLDI